MLRSAAQDADMAQTHADLRRASENLAGVIQAVGIDNWPRFLADAQDRARDPATIAAVAESWRPRDPNRDAVRPIDPVGAILGIAGVGMTRGVLAGIRAAGGAIPKQTIPERSPSAAGKPKSDSSTAKADLKEKPEPDSRDLPLSRARFGHTFERHGANATEFLTNRAKVSGQPNGQFLNDQAAARFIQENIDKTKNGSTSIPVPTGFPARVINPDGSLSSARTIRLVVRSRRLVPKRRVNRPTKSSASVPVQKFVGFADALLNGRHTAKTKN